VQRFFEDDELFAGSAGVVFDNDGSFFTGLANGDIVHVFLPPTFGKAHYLVVARLSSGDAAGCGGPWDIDREHICGRPMGMRLDIWHPGQCLLVLDAYRGLWRIDALRGTKTLLFDSQQYALALVNDLDVSPDGRLVFFTNTGRHPRNQIIRALMEARPTGSLWAVDVESGEVRMLLDGLVMPNGVTLAHDGNNLLVTVMSGIIRVALPWHKGQNMSLSSLPNTNHGHKSLEYSQFSSDLQGTVDHIRRVEGRNSYYVALGSSRALPFSLTQAIAPLPILRRLMSLMSLEMLVFFIPKSCLVVEVDEGGQVIDTVLDPSNTCFWVSEVEERDGYVYLASWRAPFFARARKSPLIKGNR
jgi:hypothetical protein